MEEQCSLAGSPTHAFAIACNACNAQQQSSTHWPLSSNHAWVIRRPQSTMEAANVRLAAQWTYQFWACSTMLIRQPPSLASVAHTCRGLQVAWQAHVTYEPSPWLEAAEHTNEVASGAHWHNMGKHSARGDHSFCSYVDQYHIHEDVECGRRACS